MNFAINEVEATIQKQTQEERHNKPDQPHYQFCSFSTAISNPKAPKEPAKTFSFDYSYWSHTTVSLIIFSVRSPV